MNHDRSRRMRSVHPEQLPLALDWSPAEVAARAHLHALPAYQHEQDPPAAVVRLRRVA